MDSPSGKQNTMPVMMFVTDVATTITDEGELRFVPTAATSIVMAMVMQNPLRVARLSITLVLFSTADFRSSRSFSLDDPHEG